MIFSKKSQSSVEFALLFSFLILIVSYIVVLMNIRMVDVQRQKDFDILEDVGEYIKTEVDLAGSSYEGYYRKFDMPSKVNGLSYEVEIYSGPSIGANYSVIKVNYTSYESYIGDYIAFSYPNVTGNIVAGENIIRKINESNVSLNP